MTTMMEEFFPEYEGKMDEIDELCVEQRPIDDKTFAFVCFALAVKARSAPEVRKQFKAALEAGATVKELNYVLAVTLHHSAVAEESWVCETLRDWPALIAGRMGGCSCSCGKQ